MRKTDDSKLPGDLLLAREVGRYASNLYGMLREPRVSGVYSLTFKSRDGVTWLAIMRRWNNQKKAFEVLFGSGSTWAMSVVHLSGQVSKGSWSKDKYAPTDDTAMMEFLSRFPNPSGAVVGGKSD